MAKDYLKCRMEHNLMAPDEMKNLGFENDENPSQAKLDGATNVKIDGTVNSQKGLR